MNTCYKLATKNVIGYFNDDMVALPDWDINLYNFLEKYPVDPLNMIISSTMIEPIGHNPCCLSPFNYGEDSQCFNYNKLIQDSNYLKTLKNNFLGNTWPPNFMHKKMWDLIGGYSEEFSPGFGSDPDLIKKAYDIGCRNFVGVGDSLVYHFACKTTRGKNFKHNNGEQQFLLKYGISINDFVYNTLNRGNPFEYINTFNS
jgi:hypothetical protein